MYHTLPRPIQDFHYLHMTCHPTRHAPQGTMHHPKGYLTTYRATCAVAVARVPTRRGAGGEEGPGLGVGQPVGTSKAGGQDV